MSNKNLKIFFALFFSGVIIFLINNYIQNPLILKNFASNIFNQAKNFKIPEIKFFTKNFNQINFQTQLPTVPEKITPIEKISLSISPTLTDEISPTYYFQPTNFPTNPPQPTAITKPTKPSKPTATPQPPPITSDERPGNTLREIFEEVSKRQCIPVALLYAFQQQESGPYFSFNNPSSVVKIYNTYGWWINGKGDPCYGLG
ncbi:MAG: hypothetical protein ACPLRN_01805, partial [Microgenomates group bacterium]